MISFLTNHRIVSLPEGVDWKISRTYKINEDNNICQWVLHHNGQIVPRWTLHRLRPEELISTNEAEASKQAAFDTAVKELPGDSFTPMPVKPMRESFDPTKNMISQYNLNECHSQGQGSFFAQCKNRRCCIHTEIHVTTKRGVHKLWQTTIGWELLVECTGRLILLKLQNM